MKATTKEFADNFFNKPKEPLTNKEKEIIKLITQ